MDSEKFIKLFFETCNDMPQTAKLMGSARTEAGRNHRRKVIAGAFYDKLMEEAKTTSAPSHITTPTTDPKPPTGEETEGVMNETSTQICECLVCRRARGTLSTEV